MDIKYNKEGVYCITKCPFNIKVPSCEKHTIRVGSLACRNCKYFVYDDDENKIVKCKCKYKYGRR